ncbi:MAG: Uma2 family endonuclease [Bacteroidales bacterium]
MPRVPPLDRPATYEDLEKVPDIIVAEIIDGELHATPRPAPRHAVAGASLGVLVGGPYGLGRGGPGGWWVLYEPELHFGRDVVVPDWAGWRRSRMPAIPEAAYFTVPPDWVCEILSPSTASLDRVKKLAIYAREQVPFAWFVDPIARTLEIMRLEGGRWTLLAAHAGTDIVRAEPFAEIDFELELLWADARE